MRHNKDTNSSKICIAIIGLGKISKNHLLSVLDLYDYCLLSAICDISNSQIDSTLNLVNDFYRQNNLENDKLNIYNDLNNLINDYKIEKINIDLVVLCTPSGMHASQTCIFSELGISVCTEKPMATKWKDAIDMVRQCKKNNVNLFVIQQMRLYPSAQLIKKQIDKGRFGKLALVNVNIFWNRSQSYYDQDKWRGSVDLDGGALMNQAIHYIDLIRWFFGDIISLNASLATIARSIETEDTAVINLKWSNNALGNISVTMLSLPKNIENSITIIGSNGSVKLGGESSNEIQHWFFSSNDSDDDLIDNTTWANESRFIAHKRYYENIINTLNGSSDPICTSLEALKSFELIEAAHLSHKYQKNISLPLSNLEYSF